MLLNFLHPFGFICRLPPVGFSTTSCVYVVSISDFPLHPCASQQLPAFMWFQYLGFPCLWTTSSAHLVSISNFPPMCLSSNFLTFLHSLGFKIYTLQEMQRPSPCDTLGSPPRSSWKHPHLGIHLVSISKLPPFVPLSNFLRSFSWSQDFPFGPFTTFCMHLHVVCMSQLPPVSQRLLALIWFQYLTSPPCASHQIPELPASLSFNIYTSPLASAQLLAFILFQYLNFLPGAPQQLPAFILFQYLTFLPGAPWQLLAFMWFQYLSFPPRLSNFLRSSCFDDV